MFQSTHPRRVWLHSRFFGQTLAEVSIHTPTKGVTYSFSWCICFFAVSIHTPTKGVTSVIPILWYDDISFNPHTHEGCDSSFLPLQAGASVSIHTPTKGVTLAFWFFWAMPKVSIHTPTKGVTSSYARDLQNRIVSIHTPTKGVTLDFNLEDSWYAVSIHTPTKGVTFLYCLYSIQCPFQSTHPRRVWLMVLPR